MSKRTRAVAAALIVMLEAERDSLRQGADRAKERAREVEATVLYATVNAKTAAIFALGTYMERNP